MLTLTVFALNIYYTSIKLIALVCSTVDVNKHTCPYCGVMDKCMIMTFVTLTWIYSLRNHQWLEMIYEGWNSLLKF